MPKIRRKFFVSKRFQGFFALYLSLTIVVLALFLGMEMFRSFLASYGINLEEGGTVSVPFITESSPFAEPLGELDIGFILKGLLLLVWGLLMVGIAYILTANKFSGPIYRINVTLKQVATGDYSIRVRFRARDEAFHEVAKNFNIMMDGIHNNIKKDIQLITEIEDIIDKDKDKALGEIKSILSNWKVEKKKLITPRETKQKPKPAKG